MTIMQENMITEKKLYGLNRYFLDLIKLFEIKKLPKVLMLTGKKGQGKSTLIHHLMAYIFDKKNYDLDLVKITGKNKIFENINENYNSNVIYYDCSDKNVKIEDIRKLRINLQKSSINNLNRFIIFDDVECLNQNCVNALLKTIEEPTETNFFILINNQTKLILDTLRSRSIEIMIFLNNKVKLEIIEKILSDFKIEQKIDLNSLTLTPGNYLNYNRIIIDEKLDINDNLITNVEKLIKLSKLKKDIIYLNFAIYLINKYFFFKVKNEPYEDIFNEKRINIIKMIHQANKLNLNNANLITEIENIIQ